MSDTLRDRCVDVLRDLVLKGDMAAVDAAREWEREFVAIFPNLRKIGSLDPAEREFVDEHLRQRVPKFSLTTSSTYFLTDGDITAWITTVGVRLYRMDRSALVGVKKRVDVKNAAVSMFQDLYTADNLTGYHGELTAIALRISQALGCGESAVEKNVRPLYQDLLARKR